MSEDSLLRLVDSMPFLVSTLMLVTLVAAHGDDWAMEHFFPVLDPLILADATERNVPAPIAGLEEPAETVGATAAGQRPRFVAVFDRALHEHVARALGIEHARLVQRFALHASPRGRESIDADSGQSVGGGARRWSGVEPANACTSAGSCCSSAPAAGVTGIAGGGYSTIATASARIARTTRSAT